jgi:transcriptional regulator NrdR family protein
MVCIYCGGETQVTNSRWQKRSNSTWRRRQCKSCGAITTTQEVTDLSKSLVVTNRSGAFSAFLRDQLFVDIYEAVRHRKTALDDATALTDTIITRILARADAGNVPSTTISQLTHDTLSAFDHAAATHYQAYHPN